MARSIATNTSVGLAELLDFVRMLLATTRRDGRPQISPVSGGVDPQDRIVISTYPARAKTRNAERNPKVTVLVLSDDWNGPWVQVTATPTCCTCRRPSTAWSSTSAASGEHPDWDEYREAMRIQNKSLIRITPTRWGPIATGGFPADIAARLDG
jgi:PPOX class probable F420-dependent enzyme